jgi:hypothetical protein
MDNKINNSYYECKRCFYKSYQKNDMKKHLEKKNLCERKVESYKYNNEDLYNLSLERNYNTEKENVCKDCNKNFYNNANLKRHMDKYCKKNNNVIDETVNASPIIGKLQDVCQIGENNINNVSNSNITNNSNNNINININIARSFDDEWDTSKIDINKKILLLVTNSKFTKTLENILENEVNLNVLIDTTTENGLVYNNKEFTKMNIKDIVKKTMSKLHKHLTEFHSDILNNDNDKPNKDKLDIDKKHLDLSLQNINNKYTNFTNSKDIQKTVKEYITDIYDKKNIDTINYINNNNNGY